MRVIQLNTATTVLIFAICICTIPQSYADDAFFGTDIGFMNSDIGGASFSTMQMRGRLGIELSDDLYPKLGLESHFGFDLSDDTQSVGGVDETVSINNLVGIYGTATFELSDAASLYGLLGFTSLQAKGNFGNGSLPLEKTDSGISLGIGGAFAIPFNLEAFIELSKLVSDKFDVFSLGVGVRFKL